MFVIKSSAGVKLEGNLRIPLHMWMRSLWWYGMDHYCPDDDDKNWWKQVDLFAQFLFKMPLPHGKLIQNIYNII